MFARNFSTPILVATCLVVATACMLASQSAAGTVPPRFLETAFKKICSRVKDYVEDSVKQNIIDSSDIMKEYKNVVAAASGRFEEKLNSNELTDLDEQELADEFRKLVIDELEKFRANIEKGKVTETASTDGLDASTKQCLNGGATNEADDEELDDDNLWPDWNPEVMTEKQDLNNEALIVAHKRADENKARIKQLLAEARDKNELEFNLELKSKLIAKLEESDKEMGAAFNENTKRKLKERSHSVLKDLVENEARVIATTVITAYMTGDGSEGVKKVLAPLLTAIKQKLVAFLIHMVTDVLHSLVPEAPKQITQAGETDEGEQEQEQQRIQEQSQQLPQPRPVAVEA